MQILYIFLAVVVVMLLGWGCYFVYKIYRSKYLKRSLELELFSVELPQTILKEGEQKKIKEEINASEQLFSALSMLETPFFLEAAVHHIGEDIHFYIGVHKDVAHSIVKQIQSIWPGGQIKPALEYNIFNPSGISCAAYIIQKESYTLPIRTYAELESDTFSQIIGGLSKLDEIGEGAAIQILVNPAPKSARVAIGSRIKRLKEGETLKAVLNVLPSLSEFAKTMAPKKKEPEQPKPKVVDEQAVKALEMKVSKPLFSVNIRVLGSGPTQMHADALVNGVITGFSQFSAPFRNNFKIVRPRNADKLNYQFIFREFDRSQMAILNSEELSSIFHLPTASTNIPRIKWLKAKESNPPSNLPDSGVFIGETSFRGEQKPVFISDADRRRHLYIIGQTGTGKTTLIYNMAVNDIRDGKGVAVLDPNGDLIEALLQSIPPERVDDLILFDPGDLERPLGLNMLEYDPEKPEQKSMINDELMLIFDRLFDMKTVGGPMFLRYASNALMLLMDDPEEGATLVDVPRVFTDHEFRNRLVAKCKNPLVQDFWEKEASKVKGEYSLENTAPYFTSKFNSFIASDYVRPIIAQSKSVFDFRKIMDEGKILLVNLSKGKIGEINSSLLGMIIAGKLQMSAFARADVVDQNARRDFYLYIDEFQNFTTDSISTILSEARKYRLNLIIAHQFVAQLTDKIRDAVFGNVGSMISFRIGVQDAEKIVKQFEPAFNQNDLINIDNLNAYARLLISGETSRPFNIKVPILYMNNPEYAAKLKEINSLKYGKPRAEVEAKVYARLRG
ncbi:MAG: type IV secretion system DNA-binding domain-containing protein [bacterium]|nr:type IV secretion system DNA-binding domain-containing protein [bacterium]